MPRMDHPWAAWLPQVEKPGRYLGGEVNAVVKDEEGAILCRYAHCFPDLYDIGMSHLGTKILYKIINQAPDLAMERCFCPWFDVEARLREQGLPLISLETRRPLTAFDVVGFSLQYEMTFTNVLTMLELGGLPLRAADRGEGDPLVIAGGPTATHPEAVAPFFDGILIGDAEERLPELLRRVGQRRREGMSRAGILLELAREGGVYVPGLYRRSIDSNTGLMVVDGPLAEGVPGRIRRCVVEDLNRWPFPDDSPVAVSEAIFDRMSIEIARGCTEGCRFCQAGMIYRPVRERKPEQIVETLVAAIRKGGYDEASLTSLSTADYSCISPLVKQVMERLRPEKIGLGISSLRAYGLSEELLDEISSVKATGLTFAPEAGTQRMRDVINKNVSEADILATCERVFGRGWQKMKLYFILGLPTETDEDLDGIVAMAAQAVRIGRRHHRSVAVTVSVSSHVPKPHTPFQWCAMDSLPEIARKQERIRMQARTAGFKFRRHEARVSHLEGIIGRGDWRSADLIEDAWRRGCRFDSWDERLDWERWQQALTAWEARHGLSRQDFLRTLPLDARLPWDHIDIGLKEGFLASEYRRALHGRLSPPCGKPKGLQTHHDNLRQAREDTRKLVCYHCGIACDLSQMREERFGHLEVLGALEPAEPGGPSHREQALERIAGGRAPHDFGQGRPLRLRMRFERLGTGRLQSQLDLVRLLPQLLRRAGLALHYSQGFSPHPVISFGPALSMGAGSLSDLVEAALSAPPPAGEALRSALQASCPQGLVCRDARLLGEGEAILSRSLAAVDWLVPLEDAEQSLPGEEEERLGNLRRQLRASLHRGPGVVEVLRKGQVRRVDLAERLLGAAIVRTDPWVEDTDLEPDQAALWLRVALGDGAGLKPAEWVAALLGPGERAADLLRLAQWIDTGAGLEDPLDGRPAPPPPVLSPCPVNLESR
jgi:radical SAM family uncharacterized protein/radical SAM-linked protein